MDFSNKNWLGSVHLPLLFALATTTLARAEAPAVNFNRDIRPILSENCYFCHGPDPETREADLRLDSYEGAIEDRDGARAVNPADLAKSELIYRILTDDTDELMPPPKSHKKLKPHQKAALKAWVESGAAYENHWAFTPPAKPAPSAAAANPIDAFIDQRLASAKLTPLPEADRRTLIRRLTFDLTGLPPTPDEVEAFLADQSANAYEKLVGRLLASPHYGERMTLAWMDAARYGDTSVMHADGPRDMWPWRDWVIRAYNSNKPFDEFTVEQLAGDLLPNATVDQKVASGFNRNNATSDEGGAIPEELRVEYAVDRVMTTSNVWLALSMECAQCHSHKYDPITHEDYYAFYAFFNNSADPGMQTRKGNAAPLVKIPSPAQAEVLKKLQASRKSAADQLATNKKTARAAFETWAADISARGPNALSEPPGLAHRFAYSTEKKAFDDLAREGATAPGCDFSPADGRPGAIVLDGKTTAAFNEFPQIERDQSLSFSAWVYLPADTSGAIFARMDVDNKYRGYDFWIEGRGIGTHIINEWPANGLKVVSETKLALKKWQHVVVTYDGKSKAKGVKIYIDGKLSKNAVQKDNLRATIATEIPFRIGGRSKGALAVANVDELRIYRRVLAEHEVERIGHNPFGALLAKPAAERTGEETENLFTYYLASENKNHAGLAQAVTKVDAEIAALDKAIPTSMIMSDLPQRRVTYVLNRGQYDQPIEDKVIEPGVPPALGDLPEGEARNRLGLAKWLTAPDHPLTARVAVNRYWTMFFGEGLVRSVMDFGNQGTPPTHPELLDYLAVDFVESGWDVKRILKQILMSKAYRRSSRVDPTLFESDPENLLYARGPRFRLQGEFIRDQALALSGLLINQVGGPGTRPYQPEGLWNEVSLDRNVFFKQDKGEKLYRRSMYIYWKRSAPHPAMMIFDAPTREKCVVQRPRTNTPLQALVTLNDIQFVEAARHFAEHLLTSEQKDFNARVNRAFHLSTARPATDQEIAVCRDIFEKQLASFRANPKSATQYLAHGDSPRNESLDPAEHAAWTVLANMILNLDEVLTRG